MPRPCNQNTQNPDVIVAETPIVPLQPGQPLEEWWLASRALKCEVIQAPFNVSEEVEKLYHIVQEYIRERGLFDIKNTLLPVFKRAFQSPELYENVDITTNLSKVNDSIAHVLQYLLEKCLQDGGLEDCLRRTLEPLRQQSITVVRSCIAVVIKSDSDPILFKDIFGSALLLDMCRVLRSALRKEIRDCSVMLECHKNILTLLELSLSYMRFEFSVPYDDLFKPSTKNNDGLDKTAETGTVTLLIKIIPRNKARECMVEPIDLLKNAK